MPPLVDETGPVVLSNDPGEAEVTSTVTVQVLPTAMVPPLKLRLPVPEEAVNNGEPQSGEVFALEGVATTTLPGRMSLKLTPVRSWVLLGGLTSVKERVLVPLTVIELGLKALLIVGGAITVRMAEAVFPSPPFLEVTVPLVLSIAPPVVAVTVTVTVQVWLARIVPPDRLIQSVPDVTVPPHCDGLGAEATITPDGKVSLYATPVRGTWFPGGYGGPNGFVIVKVRVEVSPTAIVLGENTLLIEGGFTS